MLWEQLQNRNICKNQEWAKSEFKYKNCTPHWCKLLKELDLEMVVHSAADRPCSFKTILGLCVLVQLKTEMKLMRKHTTTELQ